MTPSGFEPSILTGSARPKCVSNTRNAVGYTFFVRVYGNANRSNRSMAGARPKRAPGRPSAVFGNRIKRDLIRIGIQQGDGVVGGPEKRAGVDHPRGVLTLVRGDMGVAVAEVVHASGDSLRHRVGLVAVGVHQLLTPQLQMPRGVVDRYPHAACVAIQIRPFPIGIPKHHTRGHTFDQQRVDHPRAADITQVQQHLGAVIDQYPYTTSRGCDVAVRV